MLNSLRSKFVDAQDASTNFNSAAVVIDRFDYLAVQAVIAGTATGTVKLQVTNDGPEVADASKTWVDVTGSSQAISSAAPAFWNYPNVGAYAFRLAYTFTANTGTLTAKFTAKGAN